MKEKVDHSIQHTFIEAIRKGDILARHRKKISDNLLEKFINVTSSEINVKLENLSKSNKGSLLILFILLALIVIMNVVAFYTFKFAFGENYYNMIYLLSEIEILIILTSIFALDFLVLFIAKQKLPNVMDLSFDITIALINFILVGITVAILFGQLHNVEKITVEDKNEKKYHLLVGKIPHYEVIQNPLEDKRDIILEQKNTYDVLKNLDDGSEAGKTLPSGESRFVKITSSSNKPIRIQIITLISFTAPRLLMPIFIKPKY